MRNIALILFAVVALTALPASAACRYWNCQESENTATCYLFFCNGSGCNTPGTIYAARREVTCDRMVGGGCFCDREGTDCFDV